METTIATLDSSAIAVVTAAAAVLALIIFIIRSSSERKRLVNEYEDEKDALQGKITALSSAKAALESTLAAREAFETQLKAAQEEARAAQQLQHEKEIESMKDAFKALSAENSAVFRSQSSETIGEMLKPLGEKFAEFNRTVIESQKESAEQHASLKENIAIVMKQSQTVGDEARNLANALTGYSKVQGDFGEMLLTDVLKNSGLVEGVHFFTQSVMTDASGHEIKSDEGRTMIPDVMVCYPDDTTVIVDSKVSLTAFKEYMAAQSTEERKRLAKAHVESVRRHVDELKTKDYASYLPEGRRKVKDNIMFIPVEGAFRLMLEEDPILWQVAKDNNVLIVSQMTLIIVLNMIQMAWKQASQEKNIAEVYRTAEELMSQIRSWLTEYSNLGESLEKASKAYREATMKLKDSNQSVVRKIEKLEKLGLSPKRSKGKIKTGTRLPSPESVIPRSLQTEGPTDGQEAE